MKTALLALVLFILNAPAQSEDVLYMGKYYRNVVLQLCAPQKKVILSSDDGIVAVSWITLSSDFRAAYKGKYEALLRADAEKEEALRAAKDPILQAKVKARVKSIKEVETNSVEFVGKLFWLSGEVDVSSNYGSRYDGAQNTHYAFRLRDDGGWCYLYRHRIYGDELRKSILAGGGNAKMLCLVEILPYRTYSNDSTIYAEVLAAIPAMPDPPPAKPNFGQRPIAPKVFERGQARAQSELGYGQGEGVPKDSVKAVEWFRKAAEQGYDLAQYNLGVMYANGEGVPYDPVKAVEWYRKAAKQGEAKAQTKLGLMYADGKGVPKDAVEAMAWFNIAAAAGNEDAIKYLGIMEHQAGREKSLTAQRRSKEILEEIEAAKAARASSKGN